MDDSNTSVTSLLTKAKDELQREPYKPSVELAVSLVNSATRALAQAETPEAMRGIRSQLTTVEHWFKQQKATLIESNLIVAERLRTERKIGEWLRDNMQHGGDRQSEKARLPRVTLLSDAGISRKDSHRWQRMAAIDEADFELWVEEGLNDKELSTAAVLRLWRMLHWKATGVEDREQIDTGVREWSTSKTSRFSVQPGQVWRLGEHRVMCGDAYNANDVEKLIGNARVDALITDPPYGIDYKPKWDKWDGTPTEHRPIIGDKIPFKPEGLLDFPTVCLWGANYYSNLLPIGGWVCWDKRLGEAADKMFGSPFELAWYVSQHTSQRAIMIRVLHAGVINADSELGNNQERVHPTQKPIKLMVEVLRKLTMRGELVIDLFAGSGSILLACHHAKRKCYAMEIEPEYVQIVLGRWLESTGEEPVIQEGDYAGD